LHTKASDGSFVKLLNIQNHGSQAAQIQAQNFKNEIKKRAIGTVEVCVLLINFLDDINKSYGLQDLTMEQCVSGSQPPPKRLKYRKIDEKLSNLVKSYDLKSDYVDYLRGIAHNVKME
jgi:hypothetical protein